MEEVAAAEDEERTSRRRWGRVKGKRGVGSGRVRGKKGGQGVEASGNAMGSLPGMKYVGIDLFKA